jgi:hypothetical protein
VEVTQSFVDYIKSKPIVFEVFGHYQQHPPHLQGQELNRLDQIFKAFVVLLWFLVPQLLERKISLRD